MKNGFAVFFAVVVALGASWAGLVLAPVMQLGVQKQSAILNSSDNWPQQRTGSASLGLQVYRANGCAACHTEQLRQESMAVEVTLTGLNKTKPEDFKAFVRSLFILPELAGATNDIAAALDGWKGDLPATILTTQEKAMADAMADRLKAAGLKSENHILAIGADLPRWGQRRSVAADFLYDAPVQLGNLRVGPDLASVGTRSDANTLYKHLYDPRAVTKNSTMPPFRFLFTTKTTATEPPELIPTEDAKNLVAYLLSLRADAPVYEAPFTPLTSAKP